MSCANRQSPAYAYFEKVYSQDSTRMSTTPMPKPTSCPDFEEHCANRQSAATEYFEMASNDEQLEDERAINKSLRSQLHCAEKLIHLLHIEIDDRREINELDEEKTWFLVDAIKDAMKKYEDMLKYSNILQKFLERHRELAIKREKKEARQAKLKARRQAVLEFCGLASFIADVKKKMGKDKTSTQDDNEGNEALARDMHDIGKDTEAENKHGISKTDSRTDSGVYTSDAPQKPADNAEAPNDQSTTAAAAAVHPAEALHSHPPSQTEPYDPSKLKPKPLILKGPIEKPVLSFSGSGGSDEFDIALQVVKKNGTYITRALGVLEQVMDELNSGTWRVGFRKGLRKRGVLPFTPH